MKTIKTAAAYPLCWPDGWERTAHGGRRNLGSRMNLAKAAGTVYAAVRALGGKDLILSTNVPVRNDGLPYGSGVAEPQDCGAAVYFQYKGTTVTMACDRFFWVSQNVRAIALSIESIRALERYGASELMERAFRGFTALPEQVGEHWREILDLPREGKITADQVESQFRALVKVMHPDVGGDAEAFHCLVVARENARRDLGVTR